MKSSRCPYLQPTSGFQTSSSTSCKMGSVHVLLTYVRGCDWSDSHLWPAAWTWASLQTSRTSTWAMTGWCGTTNPSRWSRRARSTSTTSPSTCRSAAWPSRAGYTPVRLLSYVWPHYCPAATRCNLITAFTLNLKEWVLWSLFSPIIEAPALNTTPETQKHRCFLITWALVPTSRTRFWLIV